MMKNSLAEALKQAHVVLARDLRELEQASQCSSSGDLDGLRAQLGATHAHVTEHFRFEEQNGYMDAVRKREPRLERIIRELAEEHSQLRSSLEELIGEARVTSSLGGLLRERIRTWVKRVRQHEMRENDVVQDAFNLDIGAED